MLPHISTIIFLACLYVSSLKDSRSSSGTSFVNIASISYLSMSPLLSVSAAVKIFWQSLSNSSLESVCLTAYMSFGSNSTGISFCAGAGCCRLELSSSCDSSMILSSCLRMAPSWSTFYCFSAISYFFSSSTIVLIIKIKTLPLFKLFSEIKRWSLRFDWLVITKLGYSSTSVFQS